MTRIEALLTAFRGRPQACAICGCSVDGPHLCQACSYEAERKDEAAARRARMRAVFPAALLRDPSGAPWSGNGPWLPPRTLAELSTEERLIDAEKACQRASKWHYGRSRVLVIRGCVGAFKTSLAAALMMARLSRDPLHDAWLVRAGALARSADDLTDEAAAARATAWSRVRQSSAHVTLDDLGSELSARHDPIAVRTAIQERSDRAWRTVVTTSIGDDCSPRDFAELLASRYEADIARRLTDPAHVDTIHLRRRAK